MVESLPFVITALTMDKIIVFLIACFAIPLSRLPLSWLQKTGSTLGKALIHLNPKRAHITRCNLNACFPELDHKEKKVLFKKTAAETGKWIMEAFFAWYGSTKQLSNKIRIKNPELLQQAFSENRGVIIVLPHLGNWEILNFYIPYHYPTAAFYKPSDSKIVEHIISNSRARTQLELFSTDNKGMRRAFKHLKKGGVLVILSDHLPTRDAGVYAPFFGHQALTGKLTQSLANFNQSNIIVAATYRLDDGEGFEGVFKKVEGMHTKDVVAAATKMNSAIEKMIRKAPEQYQWVYKRFAKQPKGQKDIYS